ncbi:hypothetical protein [Streptomyces sp. NBC_00009]|uniref:hypothetical protein n=1 Tax=Streptomyces sp. NBC_00009 TaxID=2975620 RepID=UPI0032462405
MTLTEHQLRITRSAHDRVATYGQAPTVRELASAASVLDSSIAYQPRKMREQGS